MYRYLLPALLLFSTVHAQPPEQWSSSEMFLAMKKLKVLGSVLYLAAHPDDENTRLITYFSKDRLYRTGYLSITRGDGGQNLIGDEQGIELGLIRTQELLSARRIDGGEQFFTRAYDFGYSKNPEETFSKWDREKILADVVWVIRRFRPDVIITRFPTTGEGGHGHHTASAILANEAFSAAADPHRFPEQLKYVDTWQAKRIFWNTFNFGGRNTTSEDQFKIDVGGYNPLLGKSYGEIAADSRSQHKSQGFGATASRGESYEYLKLTGGSEVSNDLMEGVELGWKRVAGGASIEKKVNKLIGSFDPLQPQRSVPGLVGLYRSVNALPAGNWKQQKLSEIKMLIAQCSGIFFSATTNAPFAVQTDSIRVDFIINDRLGSGAVVKRISMSGFDTSMNAAAERNRNISFRRIIPVSLATDITQPYWLRSRMEEGYYAVYDQQKIGQPGVDPAYLVDFEMNIAGEDIVFRTELKYRFTDPVKGERYEPLAVIPPVEVSFVHENNFSLNDGPAIVPVTLRMHTDEAMLDTLDISHSPAWRLTQHGYDYNVRRKRVETITAELEPLNGGANRIEEIDATGYYGTGSWSSDTRVIAYDHIPTIVYARPAQAKLVRLNVKIAGRKVGYIAGAGDKVPQALEQMGYEVIMLTDKELARNNLQQFDAIVTGVRAYNTNAWMNDYYDKLMEYVHEGGRLVVQYNTSNMVGPLRAKIGPYDFNVSRTRVTDEKAEVRILKPDHPVLNFPNKITQADFEGWIQERSIYHASNWDSTHFETILSMNDPGEDPDEGSLIIAKYGKGTFAYTGLVFFRELPAGLPGAYRLMANLLSN